MRFELTLDTFLACSLFQLGYGAKLQWAWWDSNPQHSGFKSDASADCATGPKIKL